MAESGIAWQPWAKESFERARREDKPILLRISATWCHWCHVMDGTSDREPAAQRLIAEGFVPVRVDTDRLPDVNERYNMGGWPTTAFLTPEGDVLYGETYIPPDRFAPLLAEVARVWRENRDEVRRQLREHAERHRGPDPETDRPERDARAAVGAVADALRAHVDPLHGGFGQAPKFPHPDALEFCLLAADAGGHADLLPVARRALDKMAVGDIWDREEKGFFRYATRPDWGLPHYEKMLESNARLLGLYAAAHVRWGGGPYAEVAEGIVAFAGTVLRRPEGAYGHSQDADEEYYALPLAQRRARKAPFVDRTVCTNYNASLASGLLRAAAALDRPSWVADAEAILTFLRDVMWDTSQGVAHWWDGSPHGRNLLDDHAYLLRALLDAFEATAKPGYLRWFADVAKQTERFLGTEGGAFRDRPEEKEALGRLREERKPLPPNGLVAQSFARAAALTGDVRYRDAAQALLDDLGPSLAGHGLFASDLAAASLALRTEPLRLAVLAAEGDATGRALHAAALRAPWAWKVVEVVRPGDEAKLRARGFESVKGPALFPCVGTTCGAPLRDPAKAAAEAVSFAAARSAGTGQRL